jgi:hypothetical protein
MGIGNAVGVRPGYGEASVNSEQAPKRGVVLDPECRLQVSIPETSPLSEGRGESESGPGPAQTQTSDKTNSLARKGEEKDGVGTLRPAPSIPTTAEVSVGSIVGSDPNTETNLDQNRTESGESGNGNIGRRSSPESAPRMRKVEDAQDEVESRAGVNSRTQASLTNGASFFFLNTSKLVRLEDRYLSRFFNLSHI